jgi:hypothetical protein
MSHNVPAVWNVFSSKKADNLFQSLINQRYTRSNGFVKHFFANFLKKNLSAKTSKILSLDQAIAYVPALDPKKR